MNEYRKQDHSMRNKLIGVYAAGVVTVMAISKITSPSAEKLYLRSMEVMGQDPQKYSQTILDGYNISDRLVGMVYSSKPLNEGSPSWDQVAKRMEKNETGLNLVIDYKGPDNQMHCYTAIEEKGSLAFEDKSSRSTLGWKIKETISGIAGKVKEKIDYIGKPAEDAGRKLGKNIDDVTGQVVEDTLEAVDQIHGKKHGIEVWVK